MLSQGAEILFYRLIVKADDFGRFHANPKIIIGSCFPLRMPKVKQVVEWLSELCQAGLIHIYSADGDKKYIQFETWSNHQQRRSNKSKFPEPIAIDINCNQLLANVPVNENVNENENVNVNENANAPKGKPVLDDFNKFWELYPKKVGKKDALKAWQKLKPDEALTKTIVDGVKKWQELKQWAEDGGRFIPHPATFLNGERWNDECEPAKPRYIHKNYDTGGDFFDDDSGGDID